MIFPNRRGASAEARSFGEGAEYGRVLAAILLPLVLVLWGMILLSIPRSRSTCSKSTCDPGGLVHSEVESDPVR